MTRARRAFLVAAVAAGAAGAGYALNAWWRAGALAEVATEIMAARLTDLEGRTQSLERWRGRVVVVNFWATWCAPCREEIPVFVKLQSKHAPRGLQFVGIAIDQRDKVERFVHDYSMNYPVLLGGMDMVELSRRAGNRLGALPFTIVMDRNGGIASVQLGAMKEARLESLFSTLL